MHNLTSLAFRLVICATVAAPLAACSTGSGAATDGGLLGAAEGGEGPVGPGVGEGDAAAGVPPVATKPLTVFGAYAVNQLFLGDTDRSGTAVTGAWKSYGENLDGLVSTKTAQGECKLAAGADSAKRLDGNDGIDNAFGHVVIGFLLGMVPTPSRTTNEAISAGARTPMFELLPSPSRFGFVTAGALQTRPTFLPGEERAAIASTVSGAPNNPLSVSTAPAMNDEGLILSGTASETIYLDVALTATSAAWRIPLRHARVTMEVAGTEAKGTITGIAPAEELAAELEKIVGTISSTICDGTTLDTIRQTIRQASDIMVDGTQDPTQECNGISVGIGFTAKRVTANGVAPTPPPTPASCP